MRHSDENEFWALGGARNLHDTLGSHCLLWGFSMLSHQVARVYQGRLPVLQIDSGESIGNGR